MVAGDQTHVFIRGLRQRRKVLGHARRFRLDLRISAQLQYALMEAAANRGLSKSLIVEEALWREIGRMTLRDKSGLIQRLRYVDALITGIIATATPVRLAGRVKILGKAPMKAPVDVHAKEARQERRNELSQKAHTATNQVFDIAQSEALAQENQVRAELYRVLAHLATVDALILKDAAEEEILEAIEKLKREQRVYEETARKLESEPKEVAT